MVRHFSLLVLAPLAVLAAATPARAEWVYVRHQNPYTRPHFYLGVEGVGVAVLGESGPRSFLQNGGGFDLLIGGRLSRSFALEFGWQPTFHNNEQDIFGDRIGTIGLDAFTLDAKLFPLHGPVQPYFVIGGGAYILGDRFSALASGPGYQIGGGMDFWLSPHASLGFKIQYRGVELYDYDRYKDNTYLSLLTGSFNFTGRF